MKRDTLFIRGCAAILGAVGLLATVAPSPATAQAFRFDQLQDRPLLWPERVATTEALSDGRNEIKQGTEVVVNAVDRQGVIVALPNQEDLTVLEPGMTDFVARANAQAQALPENVRNLTLADLVTRLDLLPPTVRTVESVQFPDKVRDKGFEIGAYRMVRAQDGTYVLAALDPAMAQKGEFHQRQSYTLGQTDFLPQLRARVAALAKEPATEPRLTAELKGKLVDAQGNPVGDDVATAKYYVVYSGAGWCGFCTKYLPTLNKAYDELRAKHPEVQFVYYASDKSGDDMLAAMQKSGIKFPAIAFDKRLAAPSLLGAITGGTPQLVAMTADGRLIHDGSPNGARGADAALNALRRELKNPK